MVKIDYVHTAAIMHNHIAHHHYSTSHHSTMVTVKLRSIVGTEHDITVSWGTRLRDIHEQVCMLYHKPFPSTKVCLGLNGKTSDELMDKPFWGLH